MDEIDQRAAPASAGEGAAALLPTAVRYGGGAGPDGREGRHRIAANARFARASVSFSGLPAGAWACLQCAFAFDAAEEAALAVDCAVIGFDFVAADGSNLDLDHVPGLARSLLDPEIAWIPGPALLGGEGVAPFRAGFRVPEQASGLVVTFRSWRNTRAFTVSDPVLLAGTPDPASAPRRRRLDGDGIRIAYALPQDIALILRGQIYAARSDEHAARVRLVYRDAEGAEIAPPYANAVSVPGLGAVINLSAQPQARRFTLALHPPGGAAVVELTFGVWEDAETPPEVELIGVPELALEDAFRLESLCDDDLLDAPAFLDRLADRLGLPEGAPAAWLEGADIDLSGTGGPILGEARSLRAGPDRSARLDGEGIVLSLAGLPDWALPEAPDWREDPFRSVAWRLAYQSLAWLLPLSALPEGLTRARTLAVAWSRANPWGQPADPLSLHPAALAPRGDVLASLLAEEGEQSARDAIAAEAARHGFALAEIVGQNALARALHGIQAATALFALARVLPAFPFAAHWDSLARESLAHGFDALLPEEGSFAEASPVRRLELLSLGQAVSSALGEGAPGPAIRLRVEAALPGLVGLLDPGGRLPPFGDSPAGLDHAGWLARLASAQTRDLVAERETTPHPEGRTAEMIVLRHDGLETGWSHFALTHAAQSPHGHRDCTSFTFASGSRRWIVEGGGADGVEVGPARHYLLSPRAHNLAFPDGREPVAGSGRLVARHTLDGAEVIALSTTMHGPDYAHTRIFVVLEEVSGMAVIDRFARAGHTLSFEGLLHLSPNALVALSGPRRALAQQEGRRLELFGFAVKGRAAGMEIVIGRDDRAHAIQGFVAAGSGGLMPAPVLRYAFSGRDVVCGGLVIAAEPEAERRLTRLLGDGEVRRLIEAE